MVWPNSLHIKNKIENPKTYWEKSAPKSLKTTLWMLLCYDLRRELLYLQSYKTRLLRKNKLNRNIIGKRSFLTIVKFYFFLEEKIKVIMITFTFPERKNIILFHIWLTSFLEERFWTSINRRFPSHTITQQHPQCSL